MRNGRFFVVPRTVGLGLDLLQLEGGGAAPAEFHGLTRDRCPIYARYRGGDLSVYVADCPDADPVTEGTLQFSENVGPPMHGAMTLDQLCALAGLTVRGQAPAVPDAADLSGGGLRDLQPGTIHYQEWLSLTSGTAEDWLMAQDVVLRLPGSNHRGGFRGVRCRTAKDLTGDWFRILLGEPPDEGDLVALLNLTDPPDRSNRVVLACTYGGFNWPADLTPRKPPASWGAMEGPLPRMAGHDPHCVTRTLMIEATVLAKDVDAVEMLQRFDADLTRAFPDIRLLAFDLQTRDRRSGLDRSEAMDPAVVSWIGGGADRWQWITNVGTVAAPDLVGFRPAPRQNLA
ncbi:hypothetical protein [Actibacterium sp. 188UL27-1]|uniref:hypothetical protein n=1 Tax=Actibacterium sp. 188UL27-1 TaxID=2786961 RepID=UPI001957B118|nr:hypothetical protein [Actibacterium sp. 188UL27-1]MBM7066421.1 hypothetical protein [Actibacterium sp. 188UL27-1]